MPKPQPDLKIAGEGDNSDEMKQHYVSEIAKRMNAIDNLRGEIKDLKNEAKESHGILKGSLAGALKLLRDTKEGRQAKKEIERQRDELFALCKDLPLFGGGKD